ncbi:DUF2345 domain-containing protein, partial [Chromobacterium vaccinii]|uniref:DUF2345 domain-containing protein n=1 Tax=Chromobacterium vaccinii TaxID=1108595 RepID=UPI0032604832
DNHGAIRAAHGLLLSTEAQNGASGKQLAREHAQSQLDSALSLSQALAETATGQLADTMETGPDEISPDNAKVGKKSDGHLQHHADALKAWEAGSNTDKDGKTAKDQSGQQPLLILSAPAGIASLTEQSQTLSAGQNLNLAAQRDANHTTGRRWLHNVGQHISLFVAGVKDKVALKLIAAKGKVQVQAQSDAMELTADKDVTITSSKDKIIVHAGDEILLTAGGAYIRIKSGNIEVHAPGKVTVKGASHTLDGPASMDWSQPQYKKIVCTEQIDAQLLTEAHPEFSGKKYVYYSADTGKKLATGALDGSGMTDRIHLPGVNNIKALIGSGEWEIL